MAAAGRAAAIAAREHQQDTNTRSFHQIEELRDLLIAEGDSAIPAVLARFPRTDRQHLRKLVLSNNGLQGSIPDVSNMPTLEWLDLASNALSGKVWAGEFFVRLKVHGCRDDMPLSTARPLL